MLLTREEMTFDFGGAKLDPVRDKELLEWMFNQFLYGEVTGIQCGHWLYDAPDLEAARFLARQSLEEKRLPADHVVLKHLPAFLDHANQCAELRLRRIGVLDRPLAEISGAKRALYVAEAYGGKALGGLASLVTLPLRLLPWFRKKRVT